MDPKKKDILFKMWSQMGPSLESFKYLGIGGENNYKLLLADFFELPGNTSEKKLLSLEKHIKDTCNDFLSLPGNSPCNGTLRMIGNDGLAYSGILGSGGSERFIQVKGLFAYRVPEDFVCEDLDTYSDIEEMYRVDECFTDDCIRDAINRLKVHIRKVYGSLILNNIELYPEDRVVGDIPIKNYS